MRGGIPEPWVSERSSGALRGDLANLPAGAIFPLPGGADVVVSGWVPLSPRETDPEGTAPASTSTAQRRRWFARRLPTRAGVAPASPVRASGGAQAGDGTESPVSVSAEDGPAPPSERSTSP